MDDFYPIPPEFFRSLYSRGIYLLQGFIRKNVDEIWYTTPRIFECDKNQFGPLPKSVLVKFIEGYFFQRIKKNLIGFLPPLRLAFLGSLRRDNGIFESIDLVHSCIQKKLKVELFIIGSGTDEKEVEQYVEKKGLSKSVRFLGFEDRGEEIAKILAKCHFGLALYPTYSSSPNWFLTSGKCRRYISQRLPIIISTVPYFAKYIHDYKAGIIVDNSADEVPSALQEIYNNPSKLEEMRRGVDKLYFQFLTDTVLEKAFNDSLKS